MVNKYTKLRLRRRLKNQKESIKQAGDSASETFDKHVVGRWRNLREVRRFAIGWLVLVALLFGGVYLQTRDLSAFYKVDLPVAGGTFREGVVGRITNMNPIFATSASDSAAASLMFSSLFTYDQENRLVGELARGHQISDDGLIYTISLRDDVFWHDGEQLTSDDVVFTYETIQHPDTRSFLSSSWSDIKIQKIDDFTVTFSLPNPFAPFLNSLTNGGILPEHILSSSLPSELRSHPFNTESPVGTGPFIFNELTIGEREASVLRLRRFDNFYRGAAALDRFVLQTYEDRDDLVNAYIEGELTAAGGLQSEDRDVINIGFDSRWYDLPLNNGVYVFMKTTDELLDDAKLRRALVLATDKLDISERLESRFTPIDGPLLRRQLGYSSEHTQADVDIQTANKLLDELGWKWRSDGLRYKDNQPLEIQMVTQSSDDYPLVAQALRDQWSEVGISLQILAVDEAAIQESHIAPHNYQTLLFGIALGKDPDVFAYWHSSQSGANGFNLSEYRNDIVDTALEGGRTRLDRDIRAAKYGTFLEQWVKDNPAIALYQSGYSYVQRDSVSGFDIRRITAPGDRFYSVNLWRINTAETVRPL